MGDPLIYRMVVRKWGNVRAAGPHMARPYLYGYAALMGAMSHVPNTRTISLAPESASHSRHPLPGSRAYKRNGATLLSADAHPLGFRAYSRTPTSGEVIWLGARNRSAFRLR